MTFIVPTNALITILCKKNVLTFVGSQLVSKHEIQGPPQDYSQCAQGGSDLQDF